MAQFPGLLLWTDAWVADTAHLSRLERGTYHDLLVLMWRTPHCRVPNDNAWLAKHMRMSAEEIVKELRPLITEFCRSDGNWITQKRLQKEFGRAFEFGERMSVWAKRRKSQQKDINSASSALRPDHNRESYLGENQHKRRSKKEAADKEARQVSAELIQLVTDKQPKEG